MYVYSQPMYERDTYTFISMKNKDEARRVSWTIFCMHVHASALKPSFVQYICKDINFVNNIIFKRLYGHTN
jgi:hypothetical protein